MKDFTNDESVVEWEMEWTERFPTPTEARRRLGNVVGVRLEPYTAIDHALEQQELNHQSAMKDYIRKLLATTHAQHKAEVEKAVREERERIQATLKGHITSAVDFAMYCAKGNQWDVDHRETYAREVEKKLLALTNKES